MTLHFFFSDTSHEVIYSNVYSMQTEGALLRLEFDSGRILWIPHTRIFNIEEKADGLGNSET